jgi:hypothetical protein
MAALLERTKYNNIQTDTSKIAPYGAFRNVLEASAIGK